MPRKSAAQLAPACPVTGVPGTETVVRVRRIPVTYLGRHASLTEYRHGSSASGLRTVVTEWHEQADERNGGHPAGATTVEVMQGDGRKPATFHRLHSQVIAPVATP